MSQIDKYGNLTDEGIKQLLENSGMGGEDKPPEPPREEFSVHLLNARGLKTATFIATRFSSLLDDIEEVCGKDGREMAIVRTKLQEAAFFAKRAMAVRKENQK